MSVAAAVMFRKWYIDDNVRMLPSINPVLPDKPCAITEEKCKI